MNRFLRRSWGFIAGLALVSALLGTWMVFLVDGKLEASYQALQAKNATQFLSQLVAKEQLDLETILVPVAYDISFVEAFDRESLTQLKKLTTAWSQKNQLKSVDYAYFDFEGDLLGDGFDSHRDWKNELSLFVKNHSDRLIKSGLYIEQDRVFQLTLVAIGGSNKPSGYLLIRSELNLEKSLEASIYQIGKFQIFPVSGDNPDFFDLHSSLDDGTGSRRLEYQGTHDLKTLDLGGQSTVGIASSTDTALHISLFLPSVIGEGYVGLSMLDLETEYFDELFNWLWIIVPVVIGLVIGFSYVMLRYIRDQILYPMDKLYLFTKMLREKNRAQRVPSFHSYPIFRRLANEMLDFFNYFQEEKIELKAKIQSVQHKLDCAKNLGQCSDFEVQLFSKQIALALKQMIENLKTVRSMFPERKIEDLDMIGRNLKVITKVSAFFSLSHIHSSAIRLAEYFARLGTRSKVLDTATMDEIESWCFKILEEFEMTRTIYKEIHQTNRNYEHVISAKIEHFRQMQLNFFKDWPQDQMNPEVVRAIREIESLQFNSDDLTSEFIRKRVEQYLEFLKKLTNKPIYPVTFQVTNLQIDRRKMEVVYQGLIEVCSLLNNLLSPPDILTSSQVGNYHDLIVHLELKEVDHEYRLELQFDETLVDMIGFLEKIEPIDYDRDNRDLIYQRLNLISTQNLDGIDQIDHPIAAMFDVVKSCQEQGWCSEISYLSRNMRLSLSLADRTFQVTPKQTRQLNRLPAPKLLKSRYHGWIMVRELILAR